MQDYNKGKKMQGTKKPAAKKAAAKKGSSLTPSQKKLPPFIQKAIMNKKKDKK
jgi:hypothetical protein